MGTSNNSSLRRCILTNTEENKKIAHFKNKKHHMAFIKGLRGVRTSQNNQYENTIDDHQDELILANRGRQESLDDNTRGL